MQVSSINSVVSSFSMPMRKSTGMANPVGDVANFSEQAKALSAKASQATDVLNSNERMFFNESFGMDLLNASKGSVSEFASSFMNPQEISFFEQFQGYENSGMYAKNQKNLGVHLSV